MRLRPSNTGRQRALRRGQGCPGGPLSTPRRAACRPPAPLPGEKPPIPPSPGSTCAPSSPRHPGRLLPAASQARPGQAGLGWPPHKHPRHRSIDRSVRPSTPRRCQPTDRTTPVPPRRAGVRCACAGTAPAHCRHRGRLPEMGRVGRG